MQIGSKPNEMVFQGRQGGDTFLVLSLDDRMLYLYKTVETLLCPKIVTCAEYKDAPYFWSETTGMMSVLSEVSRCSFAHVEEKEHAVGILESMEAYLEKL